MKKFCRISSEKGKTFGLKKLDEHRFVEGLVLDAFWYIRNGKNFSYGFGLNLKREKDMKYNGV